MLKKISEPGPPKGLKLTLFRLPIYLYRLKLGFLLGNRFIRLQHWGRVSKTLKETVLEVIGQDHTNRKIYSASGFGEQSQWYKNILYNNNVIVTLKNKACEATAGVISEEQAEAVLLRYAKKHPESMKAVARLCGYDIDGSEQSIIEFSKIIKIVEFTLNG